MKRQKGTKPHSKLELPNISQKYPPKNPSTPWKTKITMTQFQLSGLHHLEHVRRCKRQWHDAVNSQQRVRQHHATEPPTTKHWRSPNRPAGVKNLLELTIPLTELNASLNLMAKEIHEGTYRPCWVTQIFRHLLAGRKR